MVPAIVDGEFSLWESMAINLSLAKKYGGALYPKEAEAEARAWQWSFLAVSPIEPPLMTLQVARQSFPADRDVDRYYRRKLRDGTPASSNAPAPFWMAAFRSWTST